MSISSNILDPDRDTLLKVFQLAFADAFQRAHSFDASFSAACQAAITTYGNLHPELEHKMAKSCVTIMLTEELLANPHLLHSVAPETF